MEQGKMAGSNMAGVNADYQGTTVSNQLKVAGIDLVAAGNIDAECVLESRTLQEGGVCRKFVFEDNQLAGCILLGDTRGYQAALRMMRQKKDVSGYKDVMALKDFDLNLI
jgi:nitrite reductase (NADH) large subunit